MSFFDFFKNKKTPQEPEPPKTREDLENTLSVHYVENVGIPSSLGVLQRAFQKQRPPQEEEKKLLKEVFDVMASVPAGKKLLDDVADMGFEVYFEAAAGQLLGSMNGSAKKLMLCPRLHTSAAAVAVTAFHEMTHAVQNEKSHRQLQDESNLNIADAIKFDRACEAAACTEEFNFAWQIKDKHPEVIKDVSQFPMWHAFAGEMEKSGDTAKAGEACFKAWYGYKHYQEIYEKQIIDNTGYNLRNRIRKNDNKAFRESISSEDTLKYAFISDDLKKNISADFLTSKEAFSISENAVRRLDGQIKNYTDNFFRSVKDKSHHNMYSYQSGKTYAAQEQEQTETPKQSMMSSLAKISELPKAKQPITAVLQSKEAGR